MDTFKSLDNIKEFSNSVVTVGVFDGIHHGHQILLEKLNRTAKKYKVESVVITFDPHPREILNNESENICITPLTNKLKLFEELNINNVLVIPFTREFSLISGKDFINDIIVKKFKPIEIILGFNHHFGHKRTGDATLLENFKNYYQYKVNTVAALTLENKTVSSSLIRKYIREGNVSTANDLLRRLYQISGKVIKGDGRGKKLNFPTANIEPVYKNQIIPKNGVYLVNILIDGISYRGMCNIGIRPTFNSCQKELIEVHVFNLDNVNLYDKKIELFFDKYIRKEIKFDSENLLIKQLEIDKQSCLFDIENRER